MIAAVELAVRYTLTAAAGRQRGLERGFELPSTVALVGTSSVVVHGVGVGLGSCLGEGIGDGLRVVNIVVDIVQHAGGDLDCKDLPVVARFEDKG